MSNLIYGSGGHGGITGHSGPGRYQITDWEEDMMKKYPQFTIKTEYDTFSFAPTIIIIDTHEVRVSKDTHRTGEEYKLKPSNISNMSDIINETEQFIQSLIITIRDEKITTIINGH